MNKLELAKERLKKYFRETPKEVLRQEFEEFNRANFEGETLANYFAKFAEQYSHLDKLTIPKRSLYADYKEVVFSYEKQEKWGIKIDPVPVANSQNNYFSNDYFLIAA